MDQVISRKFKQAEDLIGKTPLIKITYSYKGNVRKIYIKAEQYNMSGSIKDRVAFHILKNAYEKGIIKPTDVIAEATSGNTGISFSALGSFLGHKVVIYMPDWMSKERVSLMQSYGAEVRSVSREQGGFKGSVSLCEEFAKQGNVFLPNQFSNTENTRAHYLYTAKEIISQLWKLDVTADCFVAGVGTGGTVMGTGTGLKEYFPKLTIHPLEPTNSPTLSTGFKVGSHRIQGISDEFIPDIMKLDECTSVVSVDDTDSIIMSQRLASELGLGVGISSGANLLGCILAGNRLGSDKTICTVFADDNKKYLSTDYSKKQKAREDFLTNDIELIDVVAIK